MSTEEVGYSIQPARQRRFVFSTVLNMGSSRIRPLAWQDCWVPLGGSMVTSLADVTRGGVGGSGLCFSSEEAMAESLATSFSTVLISASSPMGVCGASSSACLLSASRNPAGLTLCSAASGSRSWSGGRGESKLSPSSSACESAGFASTSVRSSAGARGASPPSPPSGAAAAPSSTAGAESSRTVSEAARPALAACARAGPGTVQRGVFGISCGACSVASCFSKVESRPSSGWLGLGSAGPGTVQRGETSDGEAASSARL
mmetsp:Transcript_40949/g.76704  ORF Transcript_40949/g.76704 Transcript_40949/m.76704 type:complete len:260 (+) Transcript_40949:1891-2670(+)